MDGISSDEIRPICKVEDKKIFIENTELYSVYGGGGGLMGVNFPKLNKYTSWKDQFNKPFFNDIYSQEQNIKKHFIFISLLLILEKHE